MPKISSAVHNLLFIVMPLINEPFKNCINSHDSYGGGIIGEPKSSTESSKKFLASNGDSVFPCSCNFDITRFHSLATFISYWILLPCGDNPRVFPSFHYFTPLIESLSHFLELYKFETLILQILRESFFNAVLNTYVALQQPH